MNRRALGSRGAKLAVSLGLMAAAAFWLVDWSRLGDDLRRFPPMAAATAVAASVATLSLLTLRWWLMIRRFVPGGFVEHAGHFWMGTIASLFTPAAVGADVYRVAALRGAEAGGATIAGVVLRERLVGLAGYCLFYLGCRAVSPAPPAPFDAIAVVLAAAVPALGVTLTVGDRVGGRLVARWRVASGGGRWSDRLEALTTAAGGGGLGGLGVSLLLTLAACGAWTVVLAALLAGLGLDAPAAVVGMIGVSAELARWLPVSLQGVGVREAVVAFGMERFGGDPAGGFAAGALAYLLHTAVCAAAGGIGAWITGTRPTTRRAPSIGADG